MALGRYMVIGMLYHCDHGYEAHKVAQTSGEVCVPLFWGVGTLMVIKIYIVEPLDMFLMIWRP